MVKQTGKGDVTSEMQFLALLIVSENDLLESQDNTAQDKMILYNSCCKWYNAPNINILISRGLKSK